MHREIKLKLNVDSGNILHSISIVIARETWLSVLAWFNIYINVKKKNHTLPVTPVLHFGVPSIENMKTVLLHRRRLGPLFHCFDLRTTNSG